MPNIWTHILFGEQLTDLFSDRLSIIETHRKLFQLGCQGPDFLYYHRFLPWQQGREMNELGGRMHREHCGAVMLDFMTQLQSLNARQPFVQACAYFIGFLTHHILDRNFHPFIHYKAGYRKWDHQRFEVILDTVMMKRKKNIETWKTPVWKQIDAGRELPAAVTTILRQTAKRWYEADMPEETWQQAYRDMVRAQKLFYDPVGWKRMCTFNQIEPLVYKRKPLAIDCLNEQEQPWGHPAVKEETYRHSVWDLWELALTDGKTVLSALLDWLQPWQDQKVDPTGKAAARQTFIDALGNLSYDTGKDCESGLEVRYSQPVW